VASVGSTRDSYGDALAEAFNSLFKAELVRNMGPRKGIDDLEIAVAEYSDWFNHRRLNCEIGLIAPAEHEDDYHRHNPAATTVATPVPEPPRSSAPKKRRRVVGPQGGRPLSPA
jgi:putative transposase